MPTLCQVVNRQIAVSSLYAKPLTQELLSPKTQRGFPTIRLEKKWQSEDLHPALFGSTTCVFSIISSPLPSSGVRWWHQVALQTCSTQGEQFNSESTQIIARTNDKSFLAFAPPEESTHLELLLLSPLYFLFGENNPVGSVDVPLCCQRHTTQVWGGTPSWPLPSLLLFLPCLSPDWFESHRYNQLRLPIPAYQSLHIQTKALYSNPNPNPVMAFVEIIIMLVVTRTQEC